MVRERQYLAGGGIHHDGRAGARAGRPDPGRELPLGDGLDVRVERELHTRALERLRSERALVEDATMGIAGDLHLLRLATDLLVEASLETRQPLRVDAHEAEHVGRELAV